jgi:hypothetical protein
VTATTSQRSGVRVLATIRGVKVRRRTGESAFDFVSGLSIDADGAPRAYHPDGSPPGLDHLANAGQPGNWWGIYTQGGVPVVQRAGDPAPGFYVSMTALANPAREERDQRRYVNASRVPYLVLPPTAHGWGGARLGDIAAVGNRRTGRIAFAIFADIGPAEKIGEGSIALARALKIPSSPKTGGQSGDIAYVVFAGSGNGKPRTRKTIDALGTDLLEAWGGAERLWNVKG